jgi:single-strand DNA-binding protein
MPKGVNKVTLLGHIGKDPEIRATQGGTTVANLSLATSERYKQGDEWVDHTEWHNLVAFQRTAEVVRDYVKKGSQILIEGKLQTKSWDDKESGQKRYKTVILISDLILLGGGQERENGNGASQTISNSANAGKGSGSSNSRKQGYSQRHEDYGDLGITDADVPF